MSFSENEMRGLLTGKCIPGDMKVNEELPSYLVRKFDALQEQVQKLAAEGAIMLRLLKDISENYCESQAESEDSIAVIDLDYICEVNTYISRDVEAENPFEASDAVIREIGAKAVEGFVSKLADQLKTAGGGDGYHSNPYPECAEYIELKGGDYVEALRAGEQP